MDEPKEEARKLILKWNIRCFLPNFEGQNVQVIDELLDPNDFKSEKEIEQYWSVPERLVDIRWILDRISAKKNLLDQQDVVFDEYIRLEHCLYRTVTTLGEWAWTYTKCIKKLDESPNAERELQTFWAENRAFCEECISSNHIGEPFRLSDDQLTEIYRFSKDLVAKTVSDARKKDLDVVAKRFAKHIEKIWSTDAETSMSLLFALDSEKQEVLQLAKEFIEKTIDYFNNPIWRKDEQSVKKLKELIDKIKKALPGWHPADAEEWSSEYTESIWQGLQELTDSVCEKINRSGIPSVTEMRQRVTAVMGILGIGGKAEKQLKKYADDQGRCIALMELDNSTRLMAFSGYLDCEDEKVRQKLHGRYDSDIMCVFGLISASFGADLVVFSNSVVDNIMRYEPESDCVLKECGPLRKELKLSITESGLSFVKKSYSCCERKILAELERRSQEPPKSAILYVKFPPCLSCFGALKHWIESGNISMELDYPQSY